MKTVRLFCVILALICSVSAHAQTLKASNVVFFPEVEAMFERGLSAFSDGRYMQARDTFGRMLNEFPEHQRITASYLMLGKSYYHLRKYDQAMTQFKALTTKYPKSSYVDDAHFQTACCYYQQDKYEDAVKEFLWVADYAKDPDLLEKGRSHTFRMLDNHFELSEMARLKNEVTGKMGSAIVTLMLARQWDKLGNEPRAVELIEEYMHDHPDHKYNDLLSKYLRKTRSDRHDGELKIGVLLPLSSDYKDYAQRVLTGIRFAEKRFNQTSKYKVRLIIKDTEGSVMTCIKAARELVADERVVAIIGELESEKTASIAPIVDYNRIPLIAPLASDNGLAAMSNYLFQVNGDLEQRGALIAKYAALNDIFFEMSLTQPIEELMMRIRQDTSITDSMIYRNRTFATLSPADTYGKEMTDAFTAMIDRLGGEIVAQKWYYEGAQDLARQYKGMREIGFARTNKDSIIELLTEDMTDFQKSRFDEDKITINTIDALFLPVYTEDIKYVIPQFAYANIDANLFGGQYWYDMDELRKKSVNRHVDSLIFEGDYFLDNFDPDFIKFRNEFRRTMNTTPEAEECYGYDAAWLIFSGIAEDHVSREDLHEYLNNLENFKAIRGPISFRANRRVNTGQRIIRVNKQKFELVK